MSEFEHVYVVFEPRKLATRAEVEETASRLGLKFPTGYADYLTTLGDGTFANYLRIWMPEKVESDLEEHRNRLSRHFVWNFDRRLTPERARETVIIGSTEVGDDLVFHPDQPDDLFVLPRHDDQVYAVGSGLIAAIDWFCDSGTLTPRSTFRYFEPRGNRERIEREISLPYRKVRDALVAAGLHDHVAWEEKSGETKNVFEILVQRAGRFKEVDGEDQGISLLIQEIGGDVFASKGGLDDDDSTDVTITHVPGLTSPKLLLLIDLLNDLEQKGERRKRSLWNLFGWFRSSE